MRRIKVYHGHGTIRDEGVELQVGDVLGSFNHDRWQVVQTETNRQNDLQRVWLEFVSGLPLPL